MADNRGEGSGVPLLLTSKGCTVQEGLLQEASKRSNSFWKEDPGRPHRGGAYRWQWALGNEQFSKEWEQHKQSDKGVPLVLIPGTSNPKGPGLGGMLGVWTRDMVTCWSTCSAHACTQ